MKRTLVFALILSFLPCHLHADGVDAYIKSEMAKREIPGLALKVIRDGKEVKSAAYGFANLELKTPAHIESVFEIGSVTKQITAGAILLLVQDGKLSLDDRIGKHLPGVPLTWNEITVRQLLNHTSGIKNYTGLDGFELTKRLNQQKFIEALARLPLDFAPGEKFKYCNSGYNLLGYIVENVSSKTYWEFLGERIFVPLGMSTMTDREPANLIPNRVDGYEKKDGRLINRDYDLTDIFSAGAIVGTVGDLAKWNAALDSDKLFTASSKVQMWTSGKLKDGSDCNYGLGWRFDEQNGRKIIGHSGSTSGFSASLQRFPEEQLAVILLCNSGELNVATTLAKSVGGFYLDGKPQAGR